MTTMRISTRVKPRLDVRGGGKVVEGNICGAPLREWILGERT
jgi:hypothetical protein